jgi:hypothetical protein
MDLNKIVHEYKTSKKGGERELRSLKKLLSDVPISLAKFEEYLKTNYNAEFTDFDLITNAELCTTDTKFFLLGELEIDEVYVIKKMINTPYPVININGEKLSEKFYDKTKKHLDKLILSNDPKSKVLSRPDCSAVAIVYEDKEKNKKHYLEINLTRDSL